MVGGGRGGGAPSKLKRAAKKILVLTCGSFSQRQSDISAVSPYNSPPTPKPGKNTSHNIVSEISAEAAATTTTTSSTNKNLCAICLDPLSYSTGSSPGQAIFTAQCCHAFHFACISSNIRHGSVTCPICRAHWTQLPRNLNTPCSLHFNKTDPILQILDDSITTHRVHRRSFLRSARYDDDDPIEPDHVPQFSRFHLSLLPVPLTHPNFQMCSHQTVGRNYCHPCGISSQHHLNSSSSKPEGSPGSTTQHFSPNGHYACQSATNVRAHLCVKLAHLPAIDLILVASPNGPHLRITKQSMALVVFSLRPIDRLAIVTYSSAAARVFPLRRMTSNGKRTALQVIERVFYMGQADPIEGLKKGVKILRDRVHKNPQSCILHLPDCPIKSYHGFNLEMPIAIHQFHVGFGVGTWNGFVMHEFEEFLARILGGAVGEIQLRIDDSRILRLGELRGGEERRIPVNLSESGHVRVEYSYVEGGVGVDECVRTGEMVVGVGDKQERSDGINAAVIIGGRTSSVESWDYRDPFMARRWARHLHGYRL